MSRSKPMAAMALLLSLLLQALLIQGCAQTAVPASPGPEGWLPILEADPALALSGSQAAAEQGWVSENAKAFSILPSGALRTSLSEAASLRREVGSLLLASPYLTWRWRVEAGPAPSGYARLHLAVGFKTGSAERRLIVAWSGEAGQTGRLERRGNAAFFIAQGGASDGNWREATLDIAELHRLAWPDINTLNSRITYVAVYTPTGSGPACEIEKLALMR